ncbi:arginine serine-rich coiled-coil 2 [Chamberlinius hualienensis]
MKRYRDSESCSDRKFSSRNSFSSTSMKEATSSSTKSSSDYRNRYSEQRNDHSSSSSGGNFRRERSSERNRSSGNRYHTDGISPQLSTTNFCNSRSREHRSSPNDRGDRDRGSYKREKRRSRSSSLDRHRSGRRRSRSKSRDRRPDSYRKPERRSRSRDGSRDRHFKCSRSAERGGRRSRSTSSSPKSSDIVVTGPDSKKLTVHIPEPVKKSGLSGETSSNLPLNDLSKMSTGRLTTPQMAIQQAMAAMNAKAQQMTGVSLPKYYNPAAVNPLKYAEQMQKRKLLWQNKEKVETKVTSTKNWEGTMFAQDQDGKMTAKFKRLMGMKEEEMEKNPFKSGMSGDQIKKQEELFRSLDQQYEQARVSTHTQRGVGLGFSSAASAPAFNIFPK